MTRGRSAASSKPSAPRSDKYDPELESYRAVATGPTIEKIAALDFVLFVELIGVTLPRARPEHAR